MNHKPSSPSPITHYIHKLTLSLLFPLILFASALFSLCMATVPAAAQSLPARTNPPQEARTNEFAMPCRHDVVYATPSDGLEGAKKQEVISQFGKVPTFFIENKGQTDNKVKYYFKGNDNVYFTDDGVMFQKTRRGERRSPLPSHTPATLQNTEDRSQESEDRSQGSGLRS